jgi:hypothetical protein
MADIALTPEYEGRVFSADIFCAEISVGKLQRLWRSLNMNFDVQNSLLLLNQNH